MENELSKTELERKKLVEMSRSDFDDMMVKRFPSIFADRNKPMTVTCMCWGFDVGPGWHPLLLDLCIKISAICRMSGAVVVADQVKEKYGTLRFYYHVSLGNSRTSSFFKRVFGLFRKTPYLQKDRIVIIDDIIRDVVNQAESASAATCEVCGQYGQVRSVCGWYSSLCEQHAEAKKNKATPCAAQEPS